MASKRIGYRVLMEIYPSLTERDARLLSDGLKVIQQDSSFLKTMQSVRWRRSLVAKSLHIFVSFRSIHMPITIGLILDPGNDAGAIDGGDSRRDAQIFELLSQENPDVGEAIKQILLERYRDRMDASDEFNLSLRSEWQVTVSSSIQDEDYVDSESVIDDLVWGGHNCFRFTNGDKDYLVVHDGEVADEKIEGVFWVDATDSDPEKVGSDRAILRPDKEVEKVLFDLEAELSHWDTYEDEPSSYISLDAKNSSASPQQAIDSQNALTGSSDLTILFLGRSGGNVCISDWELERSSTMVQALCDHLTLDGMKEALSELRQIRSQVNHFLSIS